MILFMFTVFDSGITMRDILEIALLIALIALPQINSIKKCPIECSCDLDVNGRYSSICEKGKSLHDDENLRKLFIDFLILIQPNPVFFFIVFVTQMQEI